MRPVASLVLDISGSDYECSWGGLDIGSGQPVPRGWYLAVLEVESQAGRAQRMLRIPLLGGVRNPIIVRVFP